VAEKGVLYSPSRWSAAQGCSSWGRHETETKSIGLFVITEHFCWFYRQSTREIEREFTAISNDLFQNISRLDEWNEKLLGLKYKDCTSPIFPSWNIKENIICNWCIQKTWLDNGFNGVKKEKSKCFLLKSSESTLEIIKLYFMENQIKSSTLRPGLWNTHCDK
jgi:hypothetical protein